MRYAALATDYDGTLARDGRVAENTLQALQRARTAGLRLILVTGRELTDLSNMFAHAELFDRVVAENGAVLLDPARATRRALAAAPPPAFIERLQRECVPLSVGHSIVSTVKPHEQAVLAAIRDLGIEWHVIFNKGSVMALPAGITKATGLTEALNDLGIAPEQTVGIGDAENDHVFLGACGLAVAVANALPALKQQADMVMTGDDGDGVAELINRLLATSNDEVMG